MFNSCWLWVQQLTTNLFSEVTFTYINTIKSNTKVYCNWLANLSQISLPTKSTLKFTQRWIINLSGADFTNRLKWRSHASCTVYQYCILALYPGRHCVLTLKGSPGAVLKQYCSSTDLTVLTLISILIDKFWHFYIHIHIITDKTTKPPGNS